MKRSIAPLAVLACVAAAFVAGSVLRADAATDADLRIATVDLDRALNESERGKVALTEIKRKIEAVGREAEKRMKRIQELKDEVQEQRLVLSPDALAEREQELKDLVKDFSRFKQDKQEELRRDESGVVKELELEIREVVREVAKERGFTLVLARTDLYPLYADESVDLTSDIIDAYNAKSAQGGNP